MKDSRTSLRKATGALALAALLALPGVSFAVDDGGLGSSVTDLRVGVHPDHTRIVIETDGKAPFVVDPSDREVIVHVDAAATAEAVTTKSPHLIWVKVEPTAIGTDVRIQLKQPVEVKSLVLTRPDRIVLDLYPKAGAAQPEPQPLPTPELLPEEEPPAPVVAEAPSEATREPEAAPTPEEEPGLPEEQEEPLVLELPKAGAEAEKPAPAAEGAPAEAGEETAAAGPGETAPGEVVAPAGSAKPAETARKPVAPTTPAAPAPSGSRFGSPFALGATAVVLLVLFVWLRRRLRTSESPRVPIPAEEGPSPFEPPARAVAVGEEAGTGESVFDVEPESLAAAHEEVPTLRPPVGAGLDAEDEAERRIAHLEKRIEELAESKDRLERQIAAQTEELRVQRAAIARTQRVLRSIAPKGDEEPSEPLVRG